MRRQAWALAVVLGSALAVFLLWSRQKPQLVGPEPEASPASALGSAPTSEVAAGHPPARWAGQSAREVEVAGATLAPEDLSPAEGELEVKVTAGDRPVASALVRLYWRGPTDPNTSVVSWRAAGVRSTGGTGTARLPASPGSYLLAVSAPGLARAMRPVTRPQGEALTRVELVLEQGVVLFGRTVARSEPVPLAEIALFAHVEDFSFGLVGGGPLEEQVLATSDPRGAFRVAGLAPGEYRVRVQAVGYAPAVRKVRVPHEGDLVIELAVAGVLEGFVVDAAGRPAAGAQVSVIGALEPVVVSTGAGGGFSAEVEPGTYEVSARRGAEAGSLPRRVTVGPGATVRGLTVQLGEAGAIEGTVTSDSKPVAGADVAVSPYLRSGDFGRTRTAEDGRFVVEGLAPGSYDVVASAPGFSPLMRRGVTLGAGQRFTLSLKLEGTAAVEGVVSDENGQPVAGALVRAQSFASVLADVPVEVRTDEQGFYRLANLEAGRARLVALRDEGSFCSPRSVDVRAGATARVDLTLVRGGVLQGRVRSRTSFEHLLVVAQGTARQGSNVETVQDNGSYRMVLAPGAYRVWPFARGQRHSQNAVTVEVEVGKSTSLDLELAGEAEGIAGVVLEPDGSPSSGATLVLMGAGSVRTAGLSGEDGRFTLGSLPEAREPMSLLARNGGRVGRVSGVRPSERSVRVQLAPAATLRGRLIDPQGSPISGFTLRMTIVEPVILGLGDNELREFTGDRYFLTEVPSGYVRVMARTVEGSAGYAEATLAPGESRELDITLLTTSHPATP